MLTLGIVVGGRFTRILTNVKPGTVLEYDRLVDITARPDIKVGDPWPPSPDPNDLIKDHECHVAVVKDGKVAQVIAPAGFATWRTVMTAGTTTKLKHRVLHNSYSDPSVSYEAIPDGETVLVGDTWPEKGGE